MSLQVPRLWGIHARPGKGVLRWVLVALPFVLCIGLYLVFSDIRHQENPNDKLLPSVVQMAEAVDRMAFTEDRRTGHYLMWTDSLASLQRLLLGVGVAAALGLLVGLNMGLFPALRTGLAPFVTFIAMIPPLAILPILFISLGVDELAKTALIFIGTFPVITRDVYLATLKLPKQQITKSLTLGASQLDIVYRLALPQVLPRLIDTVRLALGSAWLFLIAAEAIAATEGLGYRIFLVRRYLAMDVILPYVLWITLLGFLMDWLLRALLRWKFKWYLAAKD
jgi:NitT/TauT family transport system permease protein